jgi:hypothetical protein
MNWTKAITAGIVAGIALTVANFIMHGFIMANAYTKYPVFTQEEANPMFFVLLSILTSIMAAFLFAKTRQSWGAGFGGGATFGFFLGLVAFFPQFYNSMVFEGFPYHLNWCWGGIVMIGMVIMGGVLGLMIKKE